MNQNIINIINSLARGTVFEISVSWCIKNGYTAVTKSDVISFGRWFVKNCSSYGCVVVTQNNRGQSNCKTRSNNHRVYRKQ